MGRCHKDEGDRLLADNHISLAETEYRKAEEWYQKAYEQCGDYFPGINVAALRLIRASLLHTSITKEPERQADLGKLSEDLLQKAKDLAKTLTSAAAREPNRIPDERIWVYATRADAYLIREDWDAAAQLYRKALSEPGVLAYHPISIIAQVHRLLAAFARLGIKPKNDLVDPDTFFEEKK